MKFSPPSMLTTRLPDEVFSLPSTLTEGLPDEELWLPPTLTEGLPDEVFTPPPRLTEGLPNEDFTLPPRLTEGLPDEDFSLPPTLTEGLPDEVSAPSTRPALSRDRESKPRLSDEIKAFIVKGLACYETPSRVAASVHALFGVAVSRQRVYRYDPANPRPPAKRWIDLHAATRRVFLTQIADIGVAHKVVRLRMIERCAEAAEENGNHRVMLRLLEQAAKECGGVYESRKNPLSSAILPAADSES